MRRSLTTVLLAITLGFAGVLAFLWLSDLVLGRVLVLVLALAATMLGGILLRPERQMPIICDPFVLCCAFLAQFYIVGPIMMGLWGLSQIVFFRAPGIDEAVGPLLGCLLLVAAAIVGYRWRLGVLIANALPEFGPARRKFPRAWIIGAIVVAGAIGCFWWLQFQGGLWAKLGIGYGGGRYGAAFTIAFDLLILGIILWAWHLLDSPDRSRFHVLSFAGALGCAVLFFGILYGARKYLFFLFFGLLVATTLRRGVKHLPKLKLAAGMSILLVFFGVWGAVRATPVAALLGIGKAAPTVQNSDVREGYSSGLADPFGAAVLVWQVFPDQEPFRHGQTLLVTVLGFIPRAVWPDKPVGIGKDLTRYYVGPFYEPVQGFSVTITLPADLYVNFGWIGVGLGGLFLGILSRVVVSYACHGMTNGIQTRAARVLLPTVFVIGLGEVRADMSQMLAFYTLTGIPLLTILSMFRMDGKAADAAVAASPEPEASETSPAPA
ncbi:MAG TPA: hypothetical protein VMT33_06940 [Candidatus Bathyarchaeia archaeon]|nr:hypothetical protein [Candidatus Bathyarchaeia archaeon]